MGRGKKYPPEMVVYLLRKIEADVEGGKTIEQACREVGIVELTFYRWRNEFGGIEIDQAKRLKALEHENARLKRLVAELSLDKSQLKSLLAGNL